MFRLRIPVFALVMVALTTNSSFAGDGKGEFTFPGFGISAPRNGIPVSAGRFSGTFVPSPPGATYFNESKEYYGANGPEFGRFFDGATGKEYHIYQNTTHPSKPYLRCAGEDCMRMTDREFREMMRQAEEGQKKGSDKSSSPKSNEKSAHGAPMKQTTPTPTPSPKPTVAEGDCPLCDDGTGPGGHGDCPHCKGDGYLGKDDVQAINSANGGTSPGSSGGGSVPNGSGGGSNGGNGGVSAPDAGSGGCSDCGRGGSGGGGGKSPGGGGGGGSGGGGSGGGGNAMNSLMPGMMQSLLQQQQQQKQQEEERRQQEQQLKLQREADARRAEEERLRNESASKDASVDTQKNSSDGTNSTQGAGESSRPGTGSSAPPVAPQRTPSALPEDARYKELFPQLNLTP